MSRFSYEVVIVCVVYLFCLTGKCSIILKLKMKQCFSALDSFQYFYIDLKLIVPETFVAKFDEIGPTKVRMIAYVPTAIAHTLLRNHYHERCIFLSFYCKLNKAISAKF